MPLRDRDNAIGDALLAFVTRILPRYDNNRPFEPYATVALRCSLIDSLRAQAADRTITRPDMTTVQQPRRNPARTPRFHQLARLLPDLVARVFLLRYRDRKSVAAIAQELGVTHRAVRYNIEKARAAIRNRRRRNPAAPPHEKGLASLAQTKAR